MKALSIRQPWAWAIVWLGKDIENRTWRTPYRGPVLIHAAKGCTRAQYSDACDFINEITRHEIPPLDDLHFGGVIGQANIVGCVGEHRSPWFVGPLGFVLDEPMPLPFQACRGQLGIFEVGL